MRRGHPRIGGWRNDNPRHFGPRIGGTPHFRPSRGFGMMGTPRFPPPGPRPFQGAPFNSHQGPLNERISEHDRHQYHLNNRHNPPQRPQDRQQYGQRHIFPLLQRMRHGDVPDHGNQYQETPNYYEDKHKKQSHMNIGDVDHRPNTVPQKRDFNQRPSPWINPPFFEDRSHKPYRHDGGEVNKVPVHDYTGHRPPASDHYGATSGSTIDNSNTFSRSVDDTVNIVRKRLLSRESQHPSEIPPNEQGNNEGKPIETIGNYSNVHQEQPKKKTQRQKQNVKSNCDKIKNKIVDQLFMMDKDKICKLMDHPNSSTKFEYAISSLVTESQNSFNRHLRSVAEKSLCSSSTDFIHNDNNTIYEDTFMKQMQCILDPQDTVLLEDIKPMVLAELSKVLQLDDFEHRQETDETAFPVLDDQVNEYANEYNYDDYLSFETYSPGGDSAYHEQNPNQYDYEKTEMEALSNENNQKSVSSQEQFGVKPLFERRKSRKSRDYSEVRRSSSENRRKDRSVDNRSNNEAFKKNDTPVPIFDYNPENRRKDKSLDNRSSGEAFKKNDTPAPLFDYNPENRRKDKSLDNRSSGEAFKKNETPAPLFDFNPENRRKDSLDNRSSGEASKRSGTPAPLFDFNPENRRNDSLDNRSSGEAFKRSGTPVPLFDFNPENRRKESLDNRTSGEAFKRSGTPIPLFDGIAEQLSEDDDPFAELDRQYHVAVDHNFLGTDFTMSPQRPSASCTPTVKQEAPSNFDTPEKNSYNNKTHNILTPDNSSYQIKKEIDNQLKSLAQSPLKLASFSKEFSRDEKSSQRLDSVKPQYSKSYSDHSTIQTPSTTKQSESDHTLLDNNNIKREKTPEPKVIVEEIESYNTAKLSTLSHSRKRSTDQRPSHRKEKRKKSESGQSDTNKQILNKNIIINVNDCAAKSSENCDAPKSIFNLFFSKEKNDKEASKESKVDSADKSYSEKYVKRKETPRKTKDREGDAKKKHDHSSSSHSMLSPTDNTITNSNNHNPSKEDPKIKLKPIDIFGDQLKKSSGTHPAHRNTAPVPNATAKTKIENKSKSSLIQVNRKISRRHIATQVIRKSVTKETQTFESKSTSSRFCQTVRKKLTTRGSQTTPVSIRSDTSKSTDTFERMKEIDIEIQVLLQEKFKLYSSLESNESYQNTMQSLGMAVLNVNPSDNTDAEPTIDSLEEDAIVDDFTNIPVEDLEQIALESVNVEDNQPPETGKSNHRQKVEKHDRNSSASPLSTTSAKKRRKSKTPYISLIEQIITDERPLEDIISLDELEDPPTKPKKKSKKTPSKKKSKKKKVSKPVLIKATGYDLKAGYDLKECYVLLQREDFSKYLQPHIKLSEDTNINVEHEDVTKTEIIEESVVNDIQFDMLDVSEDIVIGDSCEIKMVDKNENEREDMMISEEIILDNSQSSMEDNAVDVIPTDNECKMFDFSSDENLRRDTITVTGNGDAVLAIECIDNNFIAACVDGNVYHFSGDGQLLNTLRGSNLAVTCLTIVKEKWETTVYTGSLDSRIRYYDLNTGLEKGPECNVLSPIQTMDRAWDTIFVGTKTGFVLQFECKNNMLIPVSTVKFSEQAILALRAMKEGPRKVLLVGARSEGVTIKDAQTGLLLRTLEGPKMTIYSLLFEDGKVYCGTSTNQIHVYDYASGSHVNVHEGGKGAVCLRAAGGLLFAGCYDGCVYVYCEGEPRPRAQLRGPPHMLLSLAIHGSKIIAGYNDRSLYIWKLPHSILQEIIL